MNRSRSYHAVSVWLFTCAAAVFLMAVIGAITRLTESGLSIVEWKPVTGALPPLNEADWQTQFDLYRQSPQGVKINAGMSLGEFKNIFFWEWLHRLWGRLIGVIYFVPFVYFVIRRFFCSIQLIDVPCFVIPYLFFVSFIFAFIRSFFY